jgi:calcineurin-binding protein cabin-1
MILIIRTDVGVESQAADKEEEEEDDDDGWDERWLHHYMLGKIMLKFGAPVQDGLGHFQRASDLLEEVGAAYPKKINYTSPQYLALEALEIYYRIHATSLKQLMLWEEGIFNEDYEEAVQVMKQVL